MIQRLGRYPGRPPRIVDLGPGAALTPRTATGGRRAVPDGLPEPPHIRTFRIAPVVSDVPHVVARVGDWGVECTCGWQSGALDIEREWRFHRASMGLSAQARSHG